jgi:hypothetical protein
MSGFLHMRTKPRIFILSGGGIDRQPRNKSLRCRSRFPAQKQNIDRERKHWPKLVLANGIGTGVRHPDVGAVKHYTIGI